jgi:hypothetical protein
MLLDGARRLSDDDLVRSLQGLAARERGATAELVAHLAELETRRLFLAAGYSSMFAYCLEELRLSEHEAYNRIEAARAARRFPMILPLLQDGTVNLTTVRLLAPHLTPENHVEVLQSARGLRKSQVEEIAARLAPKPDVPTTVRKLPEVKAYAPDLTSSSLSALEIAPAPPPHAAQGRTEVDAAPSCAPVVGRVTVGALSPNRYKLQLTISGDVLQKLRLAKDLLRHTIPSGDDAVVLERALDALLAELAKKKFAATEKPRPTRPTPQERSSLPSAPRVALRSRHMPAEVKRAVVLRDRGSCAYVSATGRRCGERAFVEFHHVHPYSSDGPSTVPNIELRCRRHTAYEWELLAGHAPQAKAGVTPPASP